MLAEACELVVSSPIFPPKPPPPVDGPLLVFGHVAILSATLSKNIVLVGSILRKSVILEDIAYSVNDAPSSFSCERQSFVAA